MAPRRERLSYQVRKAILMCGISRYRISKETGIAQESLSRFMTGKGGLSMEALDKVADLIGLDIAVASKAKRVMRNREA